MMPQFYMFWNQSLVLKNKHVIHIATKTDEFKLLYSLHTLGYIEFDVLCNLDCLEESLFKYVDLP